jgi:hypothetical protein
MEEWLMSTWEELVARKTGPLHIRLILDPLVAVFLAIRKGWRDANEGKPPFLLALVQQPGKRQFLFWEAASDIGKMFLIAGILDIVYQLIVFHAIHLGQSLIVATVLAILPYIVVRGLANRISKMMQRKTSQRSASPPVE